jgi:NAD(P)-dependent dehydrogenase (short-subunit alcohol dehydrogenase family)
MADDPPDDPTDDLTDDLTGQTIVVTGASDGIGAAAARALHQRGATVVVVGRSPDKTQSVADELGVEHHVVDFARLDDVRALGRQLRERHERIDVLCNNAGLIAGSRRTLTDDGHELTFQVNHLSPFLLTNLVRDRLVAAGAARVINTSSAVHVSHSIRVDLDNLDSQRGYRALRAYGTTKLENVLFTKELQRRWHADGISTAALHPGVIRSGFGRGSTLAVRLFTRSPARAMMSSPEQGADTLVWLATSTPGVDWESGGYYADRRRTTTNPQADDVDVARALWARSAELVGLTTDVDDAPPA